MLAVLALGASKSAWRVCQKRAPYLKSSKQHQRGKDVVGVLRLRAIKPPLCDRSQGASLRMTGLLGVENSSGRRQKRRNDQKSHRLLG